MPILKINGSSSGLEIEPLSKNWTYQTVVDHAQILTNTIDNEFVQIDNVRRHMNAAMAYLANLLNLANQPWYGLYVVARLESSLHDSGCEYIDLTDSTNNNALSVYSMLHSIKRISTKSTGSDTDFVGNCSRRDISQIMQLQSHQSSSWRQSICWTHHGKDILLFVGHDISTASQVRENAPYNVSNQDFIIWGHRRPILDNLVAPIASVQNSQEGNYTHYIDFPDEYVELLLKLIQQKILVQMREQVPTQLETEINQGLLQIEQLRQLSVRAEEEEREKLRYGTQQRTLYGNENR